MSALPTDYQLPHPRNLGDGTRGILRAMAEVILPRNDHLSFAREDEIVNFVDHYVMYLPPMFRAAFPLGVWVFQVAAILLCGRPFTWLGLEARQRYLAGWAESRLWWRRDLFKGIKALMMIGFFELPEVQRAIQYDPATHVAFVKNRRLQTYAQDLA